MDSASPNPPNDPLPSAEIDIVEERESPPESPRGWAFDVSVYQGGRIHRRTVTLSWADYDHWSRGATPPHKVAEAVVRVLVNANELPATDQTFDASVARHRVPNCDNAIRRAIG